MSPDALAVEEKLALVACFPVFGSTIKSATAEPTHGTDGRGVCTVYEEAWHNLAERSALGGRSNSEIHDCLVHC